jgi:hypothetical protein
LCLTAVLGLLATGAGEPGLSVGNADLDLPPQAPEDGVPGMLLAAADWGSFSSPALSYLPWQLDLPRPSRESARVGPVTVGNKDVPGVSRLTGAIRSGSRVLFAHLPAQLRGALSREMGTITIVLFSR